MADIKNKQPDVLLFVECGYKYRCLSLPSLILYTILRLIILMFIGVLCCVWLYVNAVLCIVDLRLGFITYFYVLCML